MTPKEQFIVWLNDAYSTELALIPVLKNHANDAVDYPEIHDRNMQHLEETRRQAEQVKRLIEQLGGQVSTAKSIFGTLFGQGQSVSTEFFRDEITKNFLADYAAEHFEIASYKALIATARQIGEHQCVPVLEGILREEEAMARWIEERLPLAVQIGLTKTTTSNATGRRASNRRGSAKRSKLTPTLSTVLIGGAAVGAAAVLLSRSSSGQEGKSKGVTRAKSRIAGTTEKTLSAQTSTATDESGIPTAQTSDSADLSKTATGNS
jgi:ferritin-like metal-binding protein YciE/gas vesicle protein